MKALGAAPSRLFALRRGGDDTLTGSAATDTLRGRDGDARIIGEGGANTLSC